MKKKVIVSFSGGKDSMLSLHRAVENGYDPVALMTTVNKGKGESWFHDISIEYLKKVSCSLDIPLLLVECSGDNYETTFEKALEQMKGLGVEGCIFGDIDITSHKEWCVNRCDAVGIEAIFPLWQQERERLVNEFIDLGYKAIIKKVNLEKMGSEFLGKILTKQLLEEIKKTGSDVCGENGEYHTFVFNGPLFKNEVLVKINEIKIDEKPSQLIFY
nr:diphthine--ammonia ligase [uncultured Cetobacterium sp.]